MAGLSTQGSQTDQYGMAPMFIFGISFYFEQLTNQNKRVLLCETVMGTRSHILLGVEASVNFEGQLYLEVGIYNVLKMDVEVFRGWLVLI